MVAQPVEAVWVWVFGRSAQKATYGRFSEDTSYTKDYLQASGANAILLNAVFPRAAGTLNFDLTYRWPTGSAPGFLREPNDRQHISWSTTGGAPLPWRLTPAPTPTGPESLPGDPTATTAARANSALADYARLGLESYLVATKLVGESSTLHIRAYIKSPPSSLAFADVDVLPGLVRRLTVGFSPRRACQSSRFAVGSLFFDPDLNHDAWSRTTPAATGAAQASPQVSSPAGSTSAVSQRPDTDDSAAEVAAFDQTTVDQILAKMASGDFAVPDNYAPSKTRGSAQRAFAKIVKDNYGWQCAITGITSKAFLVASHIVPWADDLTIRTDPRNGICLSTHVDKAFDSGYLSIDTDLIVHVNKAKLSDDPALLDTLRQYDGRKMRSPLAASPNPLYLQRRIDKTS